MSTRILAIDTATEACSVAVWNQGEIHALFELCPREHTQRILPMVQQVLAESGLALNQLDALAFGRGPGSFTGVRIGIGIAQGSALGADLPMIGVSTLQTMAQGAARQRRGARAGGDRCAYGEVYWGQFERRWTAAGWQAKAKPCCRRRRRWSVRSACRANGPTSAPAGNLSRPVNGSTLSVRDGQMLLPQAQDMLPLALHARQQGLAVAVENAEPTYLRNEVTRKNCRAASKRGVLCCC